MQRRSHQGCGADWLRVAASSNYCIWYDAVNPGQNLANYRFAHFPNGMFSEADPISVITAVLGPLTSGPTWAANGSSVSSNYYCAGGTTTVIDGVERSAFGLTSAGGSSGIDFTFTLSKSTPASCSANYTPVYETVNGASYLTKCKSVCSPEQSWNTVANACVKNIHLKLAEKPKDQGQTCSAKSILNPGKGNPIFPLTGAKVTTIDTGVAIGGKSLTLTYDTTRKLMNSDWRGTMSLGSLWSSSLHRNVFFSSDKASATIYRGDGSAASFKMVNGLYVSDADINDKFVSGNGIFTYTSASTLDTEIYDTNGKLLSIEDSVGGKTSFYYSDASTSSSVAPNVDYLIQVSDSTGRSINFEYVLASGENSFYDGKISKIIDTYGLPTSIGYDLIGNLSTITWPDGQTRTYLYENTGLPWAMTGIVDERSLRLSTYGYDSSGRANSTERGVAKYTVAYGSPPQETVSESLNISTLTNTYTHEWELPTGTVITEPNGSTTSWTATAVLGTPAVTSASQPAGSGCAAANSYSTIDPVSGNLLWQDDFNGNRTCFAYDASNRETVRVEGLANSVDCASVLPIAAPLPARSRKISTNWNSEWRVPAKIVRPGSVVQTVFHGQPDESNNNALANCSPVSVLSSGKAPLLACRTLVKATLDTPPDPATVDVQSASVGALLHAEGPNNSTVIVNSIDAATTFTAYGTARISTTDKKFGNSSLRFDGDGNWVDGASNSNLAFGTGDFTIEFWAKFDNPGYAGNVIGLRPSSLTNVTQGSWYITTESGHMKLFVASPTSGYSYVVTGVLSIPTGWAHFAFTRSNRTYRAFLNGALDQSIEMPLGFNFNPSMKLMVGRAFDTGMYGYIDEVRVTKGVARYVSGFTPPTVSTGSGVLLDPAVAVRSATYTYDDGGRVLTATDPSSNTTTYTYYTDSVMDGTTINPEAEGKVVLLLHGDGPNLSTAFVDSSPSAKTVATIGAATIATATSKFGGSSMRTDRNGSLEVANSADFDFGSKDFTIEFWFNPDNAGYSGELMGFAADSGSSIADGSWYLTLSGHLSLYLATNQSSSAWAAVASGINPIASSSWSHVAISRSAGVIRMFVNGKLDATLAAGAPLNFKSSMKLRVGKASPTGGFYGYMDEIRITKGIARYVQPFTPPSIAFSVPTTVPNPAFVPTASGHRAGDLQSMTNASGHVTQFTLYDSGGRVRQTVDPKGLVTNITYTPRGWVSTIAVTPPGLSARTTSYTYDQAGQVTLVTMPDGGSVSYTYDTAHRLVGVGDTMGNQIVYTLDSMGNRINEQIKDPSGVLQRTINRSFDALNRLQQITGAVQ